MYTLSSKLKIFSIVLMVAGLIGLAYGFIAAPATIEDVRELVAHDDHGQVLETPITGQGEDELEDDETGFDYVPSEHELETERTDEVDHDMISEDAELVHLEHLLHQLQNKPWAALYVAAFFFFMIPLGVLVFYAIQYASQAGWSPVLFRVMEGITGYLLPGSIIMFVLLVLSGMHFNHLFVWMDAEVVATDEIIQNKQSYLNVPFFLIRAAIYIAGWNLFRYMLRKNSIKQDDVTGIKWYKKNFKLAAGFLVFFIVTESMMAWDWIMSLDPHWFSTLFGWYVFSSMFVTAITVIALVTIYLKSRDTDYLPFVNDSHIHDLAKFMFGISIFWTYLWFSQFMLIWYSNIPEEVTYFVSRIEDYSLVFFGMVALNFVFPLLLLMNTDFKRVNWFVVMTGIIILIGHYLDIYVMVMPATVGESWFIGISELSGIAFFAGLFIFVVFNSLTKAPLLVKGNPFRKESEHYHY